MGKQVIIIGAGPAGLTAASQLIDNGHDVTIIEKDPVHVGGLSRTVRHRQWRYDLGSHRFYTKNPEILKWWKDRLPDDFIQLKRQTRIVYRGRFLSYPLRLPNVLSHLGVYESSLCVLSSAYRRCFPIRPEHSFADWVVNRFGDRLFREFFKSYTEKVWGISCSEISADWASQRIKGLSLKTAIKNALRCSTDGVKTLVDEFGYPRFGAGMMWEKTRDDIVRKGGRICMGCEVVCLKRDERQVSDVITRDRAGKLEQWSAQAVIASMPLRECALAMNPVLEEEARIAAQCLQYRHLIVVMVMIQQNSTFADHWLYIHTPDVRVGRIQNLNNWGTDLVTDRSTTCLSMDYFCSEGDDLWSLSDDEVGRLAERELQKLGLIHKAAVVDYQVQRVKQAYPVYDMKYRENVWKIRRAISRFSNLQVIGRNGMHKYNNQDHSMLTGLLAARNLSREAYDVWNVNSDAEYLEELPAS